MKYALWLVFAVISFACCPSACGQYAAKSAATSAHVSKNKLLAISFVDDIINAHNVSMVDSLVAPNYQEHQADRHYLNTRYGLKRGLRNFFAAFPDLHIRINFLTEENNIVTAQYTMTGTHTGHIYQHKPTRRKINVEGVDIIRIEDGKMTEHWGYLEEARLLRQLRTRLSQMDENDLMKIDTAKAK
jgi:steroid delta-isomerase-like uncharacterized protein